jgi:DNA-binding MarR family transcriptional regulator
MFGRRSLVNSAVLIHASFMGKKPDSRAKASGPHSSSKDVWDILTELACTNTALRRAARRLAQLYDDALAPLDLKATQISLLAEIERFSVDGKKEGPTLQDLAGRLAIQNSALTHALRPLVRDGLVELRADAEDGRTRHGVLTRLGRKRLAEALVLWAGANDRVEEVLGPDSAATLRALADEVASDEFLAAYGAGDNRVDEAGRG